jgi:anthranilate/para-aminobenzoate synthase component II
MFDAHNFITTTLFILSPSSHFKAIWQTGLLGQTVEVYRNDKITINEIKKLNPEFLVISPGPCTPNEALRILND